MVQQQIIRNTIIVQHWKRRHPAVGNITLMLCVGVTRVDLPGIQSTTPTRSIEWPRMLIWVLAKKDTHSRAVGYRAPTSLRQGRGRGFTRSRVNGYTPPKDWPDT